MTTYSTDADIDRTDTLARAALSAFSQAAIDRATARGEGTPADFAVVDFDALRTEAQTQLLMDLAARGIPQASITDTAPLRLVEVALVLANLFDAVGQWNGTTPDVYVQKGVSYRKRYTSLVGVVNPRSNEKPTGSSFGWERG